MNGILMQQYWFFFKYRNKARLFKNWPTSLFKKNNWVAMKKEKAQSEAQDSTIPDLLLLI